MPTPLFLGETLTEVSQQLWPGLARVGLLCCWEAISRASLLKFAFASVSLWAMSHRPATSS